MSPPFAWGRYVWKLVHGWTDQLDRQQWPLPKVVRWLKMFGNLLPCPACAQHFGMELGDKFDVDKGKTPASGGSYFLWSVDLRNRIATRVAGKQRTVEECRPTYDEAYYKDAWHAMQILSFAFPVNLAPQHQSEMDWFFRTMVEIFPGQTTPESWLNILGKETSWCATREKFAETVYRLRSDVQTTPKLPPLPPLAKLREEWDQEVTDSIIAFHKMHNIPLPNPKTQPNGLQVVIPKNALQAAAGTPNPKLPSQQKITATPTTPEPKPAETTATPNPPSAPLVEAASKIAAPAGEAAPKLAAPKLAAPAAKPAATSYTPLRRLLANARARAQNEPQKGQATTKSPATTKSQAPIKSQAPTKAQAHTKAQAPTKAQAKAASPSLSSAPSSSSSAPSASSTSVSSTPSASSSTSAPSPSSPSASSSGAPSPSSPSASSSGASSSGASSSSSSSASTGASSSSTSSGSGSSCGGSARCRTKWGPALFWAAIVLGVLLMVLALYAWWRMSPKSPATTSAPLPASASIPAVAALPTAAHLPLPKIEIAAAVAKAGVVEKAASVEKGAAAVEKGAAAEKGVGRGALPAGVMISAEAALPQPEVSPPPAGIVPSITVAPGSRYSLPEELGEVRITTVPYDASQVPLTAAMLADRGGGRAHRLLPHHLLRHHQGF